MPSNITTCTPGEKFNQSPDLVPIELFPKFRRQILRWAAQYKMTE